ncbi:unnamed protein product [Microthlaspi erraticum]|uniref:UBA domain-containing protein n=1 Tax=Microthlaspi erraticum TaxID=1685480 RepID=A0A6D2KML6_9BRAS|nr:unnamed protein product [Microthlaspi erraticum]
MANPPNEPSRETRDQRIAEFIGLTCVTSEETAAKHLNRYDWDVNLAVDNFWEKRSSPHSQNVSNLNRPLRIGQSNSKDDRTTASQGFSFSDPEIPPGFEHERRPSSPIEAGDEQQSPLDLIYDAIPLMKSSQEKKEDTEDDLSPKMDVWIDLICDDTKVSREEALFYLEGFKWKFHAAMEACRNKTLPPVEETPVSQKSTLAAAPMVSNQRPFSQEQPSHAAAPMVSDQWPFSQEQPFQTAAPMVSNQWPFSQEQPSQSNDDKIKQFLEVTGVGTRDEAVLCLNHKFWNIQSATDFFYKERHHLYAEDALMHQAIEMSLTEDNRGLPRSTTERGRSSGEAGEGNVTVAVPGTASSQVNKSAQLFDVPIDTVPIGTKAGRTVRPRAGRIVTTTELPVRLADASAIIVRSGQTVRDIRNAIEDRNPQGNIYYYLECIHSGKAYADLDTTVDEILSDGATELIQVTPLPSS